MQIIFCKKNPRNVEGMRLLSQIALKLGVLDDAEFLLESALEFSPNNSRIRIAYIQVLRKRQNYAGALHQAKVLLEMDKENPQFSQFSQSKQCSQEILKMLSLFLTRF